MRCAKKSKFALPDVPDRGCCRAPLAMTACEKESFLINYCLTTAVATTPRDCSIAVSTSVMFPIIMMLSRSQWLSAFSSRKSTSESTGGSRISCEIARWYGCDFFQVYEPIHSRSSQGTDGHRVFRYQIPHNAQTYNRPMSQAYEDALVIKVCGGTVAQSMGRVLADLKV